jgi:biotin transport system ATP-binding protein
MSSALTVQNLTLSLPLNKEILSDVTFSIEPNSVFLLSGKNGSGKSMLLRALKGLLPIQNGSIYLNGKDVTKKASFRNSHIALVFQDTETQIVGQTVYKDLLFGLKNTSVEGGECERRIEEVSSLLEITHLLDKRPMELSGGEKRRVAIGGVLVMKPRIIFLDEPFANLDYPGIRQVLSSILALKKSGATIVIATHEIEKVAYHCDSMMIMERGKVATWGAIRDVFTQASSYDIKVPTFKGEKLSFEELTYLV